MARIALAPIDRPSVPPLAVSARLRSQLVYFGAVEGTAGVPPLGELEYYFLKHEVQTWLDDGVISLVSPLDTDNMTEIELEEEQESFLAWLQKNDVWHIRVVE